MSKDERWLPLVQEFFHSMLISDATPYNHLRHVVLVKLAVNAATRSGPGAAPGFGKHHRVSKSAHLKIVVRSLWFKFCAERDRCTKADKLFDVRPEAQVLSCGV